VILVDSYGLLALALDRQSAAAVCKLRAGSPVTLVPPGATAPGEAAGVPSTGEGRQGEK
jgi:hypothetical protein